MPRVSVIIPTYNRQTYVSRAIDSVLSQTYRDFEVIVVDDGSVDNTKEVATAYGDAIRYVYQPNQGPGAARNLGIRSATGAYLAFLDSDDVWLPSKLAVQVELLERTGTEVCFSNVKEVDETQERCIPGVCSDRVFEEPFDLILDHRVVLYVQSMVAKAQLLRRIGGFNELLRVAEDTDLIYRMAFECAFACACSPLVCIDRTKERNGLATDEGLASPEYLLAHTEIISRAYFRCLNKSGTIRRRLRDMLGHFLSLRALGYCIDRSDREARAWAWDALHFGGRWRTYRRSLSILAMPWIVRRMHRRGGRTA